MPAPHLLKFRLTALLYATACVALASVVWIRWIAPSVTDFDVRGGHLVVEINQETSRKIMPASVDVEALLGGKPDFTWSRLLIPLWLVGLASLALLVVAMIVYRGLRKCAAILFAARSHVARPPAAPE